MATSVEPDILIVDEALSVGDGVFAKRSFDRVMQLRGGTSLLLCSHALFHVDLFCERCLWLEQGRIREFGPTSAVLPRLEIWMGSIASRASTLSAPLCKRTPPRRCRPV